MTEKAPYKFADRVQIKVAYSRYGVAHWLSRSRLADRCAMPSFRSPHALAAPARLRGRGRGTVNLMEGGRNDGRDKAGDTDGYAVTATPVTAAQVWKAWVRAARYWAAGR